MFSAWRQEFNSLVDQLRSRIITEIGHEAVNRLLKLVKKDDRQAILQTLFGLKVLSQHTSLEMQAGELPERTYDDARFRFYYEKGRWPTREEAIEYDKTIVVEPMTKRKPQ